MKMVKIFALLIFVTTLALSFQNCSPSQTPTLLGSRSSGLSEVEKINTGAPFAYDMVVDTISYNSCVGVGLNDNGLHGIRIGVNEGYADTEGKGTVKGGLKLRTDFLTYIGKNVSPIYPSPIVTPGQIQYILQNSTANKDAHIQYAIRKKSDLSVVVDVIQPNGTNPIVPGRDGLVEQASLSSDPVLTALTKKVQYGTDGSVLAEGERIFNLYEPTSAKPIQASFGYSNYTDETYPIDSNQSGAFENYGFGEAYSDRVRQRFNSTGSDQIFAAVTFGNPFTGASDNGLSEPLRKSSADTTKAYGRGYTFRFEAAGNRAGWRSNQLRQVTETNLVDNTPVTGGTSWTCENYVVMKTNEWNNPRPEEPACVPLNAVDLQNTTIAGKVKRLRRHYDDSTWNIGLFYAKNSIYAGGARAAQPICLAPKANDCYLPTKLNDAVGTDIGVNYDTSKECYLWAYPVMGVSYTGNPSVPDLRKLGRCAQYASICSRSSNNY